MRYKHSLLSVLLASAVAFGSANHLDNKDYGLDPNKTHEQYAQAARTSKDDNTWEQRNLNSNKAQYLQHMDVIALSSSYFPQINEKSDISPHVEKAQAYAQNAGSASDISEANYFYNRANEELIKAIRMQNTHIRLLESDKSKK